MATTANSDLYLQRLARKQHIAALLNTDPDDPNDSCNQNQWISSMIYPQQQQAAAAETASSSTAGGADDSRSAMLSSSSRGRHGFHVRREKRARAEDDPQQDINSSSTTEDHKRQSAVVSISPIQQIAAMTTTSTSSTAGSTFAHKESVSVVGEADPEGEEGGSASPDSDIVKLVRSYQKRCAWVEDHRRRGTFQWQSAQERVAAEFKEMLKRRQQFSRTRKTTEQ